jgi:hypothetical protein
MKWVCSVAHTEKGVMLSTDVTINILTDRTFSSKFVNMNVNLFYYY